MLFQFSKTLLKVFPIYFCLLIVTKLFSQELQLQDHWWTAHRDFGSLGVVNSIVKDDQKNTIYIGGHFNYVGPFVPFATTIDFAGNPTAMFPKPNERVFACVSDGTGGWYIGGGFTMVGDSIRNHLAHITSAGKVSSWNPNANSWVYSLVKSDSLIYAGGRFDTINGQNRNLVAAIDAISGIPSPWNPSANNFTVFALAVSDSTVYVGGDFDSIGGQNRKFLAAIDAITGQTTSWNPDVKSSFNNGRVFEIIVSEKTLYVGGRFDSIGSQHRNRIAAINTLSGQLMSWNPDADGTVRSISISEGTIYVGGDFHNIGGQNRDHLAAIDTVNGLATSWNPRANDAVHALVTSGSTVYVGGEFDSIGGQSRNHLAAFNIDSGKVNSWDPSIGGFFVASLAMYEDKIFVGGPYTSVGGEKRNHVAALNARTGRLTDWAPSVDDNINTMALSENALYVGGSLTMIGGQSRNNVGAININSGMVTSWNPNADDAVRTIMIKDSIIYIGGLFTSIDGQNRNYLAAVDDSIGSATSWAPNPNGEIWTLANSGDQLYVGGDFSTIGGQNRNNIARFTIKTGQIESWNPNADDRVFAFAISDSTIYVGGIFSTIGGQNRNRIAELDTSTGMVSSWNPNISNALNHFIRSISILNTTVYVAGDFTSVGGQDRNQMAVIDMVTGTPESWNPDLTNRAGFRPIIVACDTAIYVGGTFEVFSPGIITGIDDIFLESDIEDELLLYPNPTDGLINLHLDKHVNVSVVVRDITGKIIYERYNISNKFHQFSLNQTSGIYFLTVRNNEINQTYKVIKN